MPELINPVLPGCHPDPSICRVGEDYWLVVSSFTYWPALPVFHSRNLVDWEPAGHVIDRPEQLSLAGLETSDGIWAPTIRHHEGVYYVVSTVADGRFGAYNFVVTATDPRGPWSDPVDLGVTGIDPSLFFDADGRCWFTGCRDSVSPHATGPGEIWMQELDLKTLQLTGPEHVLWHGAVKGAWVEAPHIYLRDGVYYLLAAEGGTERNHSVTAARSSSVTGPWVTDPRSPLLTHRHLSGDHDIQNVGHADLVDTPYGESWAFVLGVRPVDGTHTLGRETFLVPVEWTDAGPVFAPELGQVRLDERAPRGSDVRERETHDVLDVPTLGTRDLPVGWSGLRGPLGTLLARVGAQELSPGDTGRSLALALSPESLSGRGTPAYIARRQQHLFAEFRAEVTFEPLSSREEAGLALFHAGHRWASLTLTLDSAGRRVVVATSEAGGGPQRGSSFSVGPGSVVLSITADTDAYEFSFLETPDVADRRVLARHARSDFSSETAGGFVGVHGGAYATSAGDLTDSTAVFNWLEYHGRPPRDHVPGQASPATNAQR